jgi:hypothetical protein
MPHHSHPQSPAAISIPHNINSVNANAKITPLDWPTFVARVHQLVITAVRITPPIIPTVPPPNSPPRIITSGHLDQIAFRVYQLSCDNCTGGLEDLFAQASNFASKLHEHKLRVLARLNYLPTWWIFRDRAKLVLVQMQEKQDWIVEDKEMGEMWRVTTLHLEGREKVEQKEK